MNGSKCTSSVLSIMSDHNIARGNRKLSISGRQSRAFLPSASGEPPCVWMSFQSALQWLHTNEDTISKLVRLLQAYPNLIQDSSLDAFWEFLEPLIQERGKDMAVATTKVNRRTKPSVNPNISRLQPAKAGVPTISVTRTRESPAQLPSIPSKKARTPRVHLISHRRPKSTSGPPASDCNGDTTHWDDLLHQCAIELLHEHFYVRVAHHNAHRLGATDNSISQQCRLSESDVCVFLFNDFTVNDAHCFHDLCTALALNIPVIYLRHHRQELPKTFTQSVERLSRGCVSLGDYIDQFVLGSREAGKGAVGKRKDVRTRNKIVPLSVRTRSCSAGDLNITGFNIKQGSRKKQKPSISDNDLLLYLLNSFKSAYVFDEHDLQSCSQNLRLGIHQAIGISEHELPPIVDSKAVNGRGKVVDSASRSQRMTDDVPQCKTRNGDASPDPCDEALDGEVKSNRLDVPEATNPRSAREWSNSGAVSAPPRDNQVQGVRFNYDFWSTVPAPVEMKNTTYLIFDDKNVDKKVRRVHFPLEESQVADNSCDTDSDEFDPRGSPIHFPDIDLAREINAAMDTTELDE